MAVLRVIVGQRYSTIAWVPEPLGSWALPLLHERINNGESPLPKAAAQLKQVCQQLANLAIAVLNREYSNVTWVLASADIPHMVLGNRSKTLTCQEWGSPIVEKTQVAVGANHGNMRSLAKISTIGVLQIISQVQKRL